MKSGEIWLVNFDPSTGREYQKVRPALVVQSNKINAPLITVMPISSSAKNKQKDDLLLPKDSRNRLFSDSLLKVGQISSFDQSRFIHFVGKIDSSVNLKVKNYLKKHFDL